MAGEYGRKVELTWDDNPVLGVREKSLTIDGEPANVTSGEDDGWQVLLEEDAERSVSIELSGVTKDTVMRDAKLNGPLRAMVALTYDDGYKISGEFQLAAYSEGHPYNEAVTFTATLMSTGPVTGTLGGA